MITDSFFTAKLINPINILGNHLSNTTLPQRGSAPAPETLAGPGVVLPRVERVRRANSSARDLRGRTEKVPSHVTPQAGRLPGLLPAEKLAGCPASQSELVLESLELPLVSVATGQDHFNDSDAAAFGEFYFRW